MILYEFVHRPTCNKAKLIQHYMVKVFLEERGKKTNEIKMWQARG